mmetsp:Transcript_33942/g.35244  ORF Transcript_33942/g.35244 Transcript_33942/m.35244 type:complete len:145 (+) Transcript_33942:1-435(+)
MKATEEDFSHLVKEEPNSIFLDENIVARFGGRITLSNALEYFSLSQFFIKDSINNICSIQKVEFDSNRFNYKGVEYTMISTEFNPYIICMSYRSSPNSTVKLRYYYCWENGEVRQAPTLYGFISSNVKGIARDLNKVMDILKEE